MSSSSSRTDTPAAAAAAPRYYSEESVAALVRSLDRAEDHHIFAVDVLKTYPYLADAYTKVCPRRCDLATAAQKALDGAYSHDARLEGLRADVALMASNCVAFNGPTSDYAETAAAFERFALEQMDKFVLEHNGGRRVSRLRLPAVGVAQTHATAATAAAPAAATGGAAAVRGGGGGVAGVAAPAAAAATTSVAAVTPTTREVVQLIDALHRREDGGAFAVDVAEAYPDLRESYRKACPQPMHLQLMRQRAKEGYYTTPATAVYGDSVATSLAKLRDDVQLLVRNCITFNAKVDSWVTLARGFQVFAHRRVDDFVLRHAAALRGTPTGAEVYPLRDAAPTTASAASGAGGGGGGGDGGAARDRVEPSRGAAAQDTDAVASSGTRKRERAEERITAIAAGGGAPPPPVQIVAEATPQVCPTPLQPALAIPPLLRRRLALDHTRRTRLPLRRVGATVSRDELYPPPPALADASAAPPATAGGDAGTPSAPTVTIDHNCSAGHALMLLRESVVAFFAARRGGTDVANAFAYSVREEQLYLSVLDIVADKYRSTAAHLLLYESESAELQEWAALRAVASSRSVQPTAEPPGSVSEALADDLHFLYLVRFLVQWPQLAALCCTMATPAEANTRRGAAGAAPSSSSSLRISRDRLKAVAQVTRITAEFLVFLETLDERQRR
ncbi:Bromodomain [Novymonas esmeraldas]|uniref:Bromodomain n=1 Tax=Novymonas esmeraldas TaxID=1808958 RepID=A0AAW0EWB8_9TRYP